MKSFWSAAHGSLPQSKSFRLSVWASDNGMTYSVGPATCRSLVLSLHDCNASAPCQLAGNVTVPWARLTVTTPSSSRLPHKPLSISRPQRLAYGATTQSNAGQSAPFEWSRETTTGLCAWAGRVSTESWGGPRGEAGGDRGAGRLPMRVGCLLRPRPGDQHRRRPGDAVAVS